MYIMLCSYFFKLIFPVITSDAPLLALPFSLFYYLSDLLLLPSRMCFVPVTLVSLLFPQNTRHDLAQDLYTNCSFARNVFAPSLCVAQALTTLGF